MYSKSSVGIYESSRLSEYDKIAFQKIWDGVQGGFASGMRHDTWKGDEGPYFMVARP
jgi:hypothetical protein